MQGSFTTKTGKSLSITPSDEIGGYGMKMAAGYSQPNKGGTFEADILVVKGAALGLMEERTVGIDVKYTNDPSYSVKDAKHLDKQLDGIRRGFRDGKVDEFLFVTNKKFTVSFCEKVEVENKRIIRDWIKNETGRSEQYLNEAEKAAREPRSSKQEMKSIWKFVSAKTETEESANSNSKWATSGTEKEILRQFASQNEIPQIDLCEYVEFKNTEK